LSNQKGRKKKRTHRNLWISKMQEYLLLCEGTTYTCDTNTETHLWISNLQTKNISFPSARVYLILRHK